MTRLHPTADRPSAPGWSDALARAQTHSPFLAAQMARFPEATALLRAGDAQGALAFAAEAGRHADVGTALRRERHALALVLAAGDLAGAFPLAFVTRTLSDLADRALDSAVRTAIEARVPGCGPEGFLALALGKHGGRELNYSSDIDPILLYDPEVLARRPRDEPGEAAARYTRDVVRLLSAPTSEGFVFRVDLRLRPASEVSPLAIPVGAALTHYESSALPWERAAFIRARAAAGDVEAGARFLHTIASFVWRRSLDFGAIDDIRQLSGRIRAHRSGPSAPAPGFNLKLGRGGIREIEFFAQTHQLIHGGRDPVLRCADTVAALRALAGAGHIAPEAAEELAGAYTILRTAEHRLQMVADAQTHSLPDGDRLENVARLAGFGDAQSWLAELTGATERAARWFDTVIAGEERVLPSGAARPASHDVAAQAPQWAERVAGWADGRYRVLRSEAARAAFAAVRDQLVAALVEAPDPPRALARWEAMLERLGSAINLFRLLEARPALTGQITRVLSLAPPLADALARQPERLDPLIDRSAFDLPGMPETLAEQMERLDRDTGYEAQLDRLRVVVGEARFALGVQLLEAAHDPLAIGAGLARVAEAAVLTATCAAETAFAEQHGRVPGGELVVLALGRLGGGLLTHASDLDLIYLFTGSHETVSDGPRPLGATLYFNRLAQRVGAALSVPTAEGALYEVDTRLRPQGPKGPLAVSLDSFGRYQLEDAWTWEAMALTRARPITGSPDARMAAQRVIRAALARPRGDEALRRDISAMRAEMARHKPAGGPWDVKLAPGGLVDAEFLVHYLQLRWQKALLPDLDAALAALVAEGLVPGDVRDAHALLTRALVAARLLAPDGAPPPAAAARMAISCGQSDPEALLRALDGARECVRAACVPLFGEQRPDAPTPKEVPTP